MALQGGEVVERLDLVQFRGMNQARQQIADPRTVQGPVEQRVLPMQDRLLEDTFKALISGVRPQAVPGVLFAGSRVCRARTGD
ncbi:hypothetical protein [Accumulibacter sp.]|uniref:hypothetical protein n=1 Tax=Accumulibacter sp. TaxID=2053492 RepID=UPI00260A0DD0|nr:hypothetical protein [Accumulibacter sp.]